MDFEFLKQVAPVFALATFTAVANVSFLRKKVYGFFGKMEDWFDERTYQKILKENGGIIFTNEEFRRRVTGK